jgi:hypothetical protein
MTARLRKPFVLNDTPAGGWFIYEVESARVEGERLRAMVKGQANADWVTVGKDGTGTIDVRSLLETDDGALIFVHYNGRVQPSKDRGATVYAAPRFDTDDERYRWLNRVQAVARGRFDGATLTYDLFEVR